MNKVEETNYAFIMEVIRDLKLNKVYKKLNIDDDILDELYKKALKMLGNFEGSNEFNPNLNSTFIIKVLLKGKNDLYLHKFSSKKYGLITLTPSLKVDFSYQIEDFLKKSQLENLSTLKIKLVKNIHINSLTKNAKIFKHLDLSKPIIYGVYEALIENEIKLPHFMKINEVEEDKISELDLCLIQSLEE